MPTYNPRQLDEPEVIREINPTVLCAFLKPFEGYLRTRGLEVKEPCRIDNAAIEKLVDVLINPTMKTPQGLLNAVFYVEEMSTEQLFNLARDPDCVENFAKHPDYIVKATALHNKLMAELNRQEDPRAMDKGDVFDQYYSPVTESKEQSIEKKTKRKYDLKLITKQQAISHHHVSSRHHLLHRFGTM